MRHSSQGKGDWKVFFVTGAPGFIRSAVVKAGRRVVGLVRSDAFAKSLTAARAEVHRCDLEDRESLRSEAAMANSRYRPTHGNAERLLRLRA